VLNIHTGVKVNESSITLRREKARLPERIEFLTRNRGAIADHLEKVLSVQSANTERQVRVMI
jgi:hypothetical protein